MPTPWTMHSGRQPAARSAQPSFSASLRTSSREMPSRPRRSQPTRTAGRQSFSRHALRSLVHGRTRFPLFRNLLLNREDLVGPAKYFGPRLCGALDDSERLKADVADEEM